MLPFINTSINARLQFSPTLWMTSDHQGETIRPTGNFAIAPAQPAAFSYGCSGVAPALMSEMHAGSVPTGSSSVGGSSAYSDTTPLIFTLYD